MLEFYECLKKHPLTNLWNAIFTKRAPRAISDASYNHNQKKKTNDWYTDHEKQSLLGFQEKTYQGTEYMFGMYT